MIVTTKQDNNSPRHRHSFEDYDEEDSSSNFQVGNIDMQPPSEDDEESSSSSYGSQDVDVQHEEDITFHSFSEHDAQSHSHYFSHQEESFDEESNSMDQSRSNQVHLGDMRPG